MSDITTGTWQQIRDELETLSVPNLQELLNSADVQFDGAYTITAEPNNYAKLCQYYPLLDTLVQDVTGKRLKLSLRSSVPMAHLPKNQKPFIALIQELLTSPKRLFLLNRLLPYQPICCVLFPMSVRELFSLPLPCGKHFTAPQESMGLINSTLRQGMQSLSM